MQTNWLETQNLIYQNKNLVKDVFKKMAILIGCIFGLIIIGFTVLYEYAPVTGTSMQPTLNVLGGTSSDIVYINRFLDFELNDIVVVKDGNNEYIIKRVVGLPGDTIEIKQTSEGIYLFRNGEKVDESYIELTDNFNAAWQAVGMQECLKNFNNLKLREQSNPNSINVFNSSGQLVVQAGQVFILGDNRNTSLDSSSQGCFKISNVVGRVDFIVPYGITAFNYFVSYFLGFNN